MATSLTPLANLTLGSTASSVTFSSISGSYRDLMLVITVFNSSQFGVYLKFNGSSSGYSNVYMEADGAGRYSGQGNTTAIDLAYDINLDGTYPNLIISSVMDYSATDKSKAVLTRDSRGAGSGTPGVSATAGCWSNTSAITSMVISAQSGSFSTGSSFCLYGVSA